MLELAAGIGAAVVSIAAPIVWWRWGDGEVAAIIGLAIPIACSTTTLIATALPWLFDRLGALMRRSAACPAATVIRDLLFIRLYFAVVVTVIE